MKTHYAPRATIGSAAALIIVALIFAASTVVTVALAAAIGSPFIVWFDDTPYLIVGVFLILLLAGLVWDGSLVLVGLASEVAWRVGRCRTTPIMTVASLRRFRFLNCGIGPIPMLLITAIAILGTSNITLMSLELLSGTTHWRDPFFWGIEGPFLQRMAALRIDPTLWDKLYHSSWGIELGAAFALVVIGRGGGAVLRYCVTMILLFYVGRLLGMLNPVMGPAFYRPEVFTYLDGSTTSDVMRLVSDVMARPSEAGTRASGILLGGVSAMPSLHVAMVTVTAYWLAVAGRWTAFVTVPWVLLVWTSTVALGWHYILDGAGGIALGAASIALTRWLLGLLEPRWPGVALMAPSAIAATPAAWPAATGTAESGPSAKTRSSG